MKTFSKTLVSLFLLTGCGYHLIDGSCEQISFHVPKIEGDSTGAFQQELIGTISKLPGFAFQPFGSDILIEVAIKNFKTEHRDFQYQTDDETGQIIERLSPVESCHDAIVEFTILKRSSRKVLLGPIEIRQKVDFDFSDFRSYQDLAFTTASGQNYTTLDFSLGQLAAEDDASFSAKLPLYQKIAGKISSYLLINSEKL